MKCTCGKDAYVQTYDGDKLAIERQYKRLHCHCGKSTEWCGSSFGDWYKWLVSQWVKITGK